MNRTVGQKAFACAARPWPEHGSVAAQESQHPHGGECEHPKSEVERRPAEVRAGLCLPVLQSQYRAIEEQGRAGAPDELIGFFAETHGAHPCFTKFQVIPPVGESGTREQRKLIRNRQYSHACRRGDVWLGLE